MSNADVADARARVAENRCLIAWVTAATAFRVSAYTYALEHLVIEAPERDAGPTERTIAALAAERVRLERLGVPPRAAVACAGALEGPGPAPAQPGTAILVRKG